MELSILNLLLVLLAAWAAGRLAERIGYPSVLGELLAGIVLGPPLLGLLDGDPALSVLAEVGILLMMLYIGMEIDPRALVKASKGGVLAALGGFITPFVACYLLVVAFGGSPMEGAFVGMAAGVTSLATKSRILVDLRLLDTRIAHVMMAGALVADTLSLLVFAALLGVAEMGAIDAAGLALVTLKALAFFGAAFLIGQRVVPWVVGRLLPHSGRAAALLLVVVLTLVFAEGAHLAGLHGILGAFAAGLCLREDVLGHKLSGELVPLVRDAALGLLAPIFFVTAGFAVSLDVFSADLGLLLGVVGMATVAKIVGTAGFYVATGHGLREGLVIGAGMNGRGAVEIIVAQIGLSMGLISQEIFSVLVVMAIATTATVPVLLKWGVAWLSRHDALVRAEDRTGTLVVGASATARTLAALLARGEAVHVLDRNAGLVERALEEGLEATCGNALDEEVLARVRAGHARRLIAVTPNAEVNALVARLARKTFLVPEVVVLHTGNAEGHAALRHHLEVQTLFGGPVRVDEWDYWIDHDQTSRATLDVARVQSARLLHRTLQPGRTLPLAVARGEGFVPFHADLELAPGDRIVVLREDAARDRTFDRFDALVARAPVLDLDGPMPLDAFFEVVAGTLAQVVDADAEVLAARLADREATTSTVLEPGLAVPHVQVDGEHRFGLVLARVRDGVHFPGHDEPVSTLVVLAGSADERNFHLRALSAVAQVVSRPDFAHDWLVAPDAEALRRLFLDAERRRQTSARD